MFDAIAGGKIGGLASVVSCHAPKYRKGDELGAMIRTAITQRCEQIKLERQGVISER